MRLWLDYMFWNLGGPIALAHLFTPFHSTVYAINGLQWRTVYIFGIRVFRHLLQK